MTKLIRIGLRDLCADKSALFSLLFLCLLILASVFAPLISPHDPDVAVNNLRFAPPGTEGFLLGTDNEGRDLLSRLIWGGRISLLVGTVPCLVAMAIGMVLGASAGYYGGWPDRIIMRTLDVLFAFPLVLLAIAIAASLQAGLSTELLSITIVLVPYFSRVAHTSTLVVREQPYIEAARSCGGRSFDILLRYVLPNITAPLVAYCATLMGIMILVGSGLSFLGLGVPPPEADWGRMIADGRVVLARAPYVTVVPGLMIVLTSLAFNFLGDGLVAMFQPRGRRLAA